MPQKSDDASSLALASDEIEATTTTRGNEQWTMWNIHLQHPSPRERERERESFPGVFAGMDGKIHQNSIIIKTDKKRAGNELVALVVLLNADEKCWALEFRCCLCGWSDKEPRSFEIQIFSVFFTYIHIAELSGGWDSSNSDWWIVPWCITAQKKAARMFKHSKKKSRESSCCCCSSSCWICYNQPPTRYYRSLLRYFTFLNTRHSTPSTVRRSVHSHYRHYSQSSNFFLHLSSAFTHKIKSSALVWCFRRLQKRVMTTKNTPHTREWKWKII